MTTEELEKEYVGTIGIATPEPNDVFEHEFEGTCIGVDGKWLQIEDQDGDVFDVEYYQFRRLK